LRPCDTSVSENPAMALCKSQIISAFDAWSCATARIDVSGDGGGIKSPSNSATLETLQQTTPFLTQLRRVGKDVGGVLAAADAPLTQGFCDRERVIDMAPPAGDNGRTAPALRPLDGVCRRFGHCRQDRFGLWSVFFGDRASLRNLSVRSQRTVTASFPRRHAVVVVDRGHQGSSLVGEIIS
jgi:hypothetical protein